MAIDLKKLSEPLPINKIDFRVQSINAHGYATILAYKDARVDMDRLDSVCGSLNWKREHSRDNHNCTVSIWDESKSQWVSKEDTGTESNTEKEKGLASDSFKRACFNWGIGRELYDYPFISIKLEENEMTRKNDKIYASWALKLKEWKWEVKFSEDFELISLLGNDSNGRNRFSYAKQLVPNGSAMDTCKMDFEALDAVRREYVANAADWSKKLFSTDGISAVCDYLEKLTIPNEEKSAMWYLFDSKLRSAIKAETKSRAGK